MVAEGGGCVKELFCCTVWILASHLFQLGQVLASAATPNMAPWRHVSLRQDPAIRHSSSDNFFKLFEDGWILASATARRFNLLRKLACAETQPFFIEQLL